MNKYDLIKLKVLINHAVTPGQMRAAIDSFPEIRGMTIKKTLGILEVAESQNTGKSLKTIRHEAEDRYFKATRKVVWRD